ncbi:hypothetical protein XENOCAPTIV_018163, partial [Xenoophorus captivus]
VVLVDSGADLLDSSFAKRLGLLTGLPQPLEAIALDGKLLRRVTHHITSVTLTFPDNHREELNFHVFSSPHH